MRSKSLKVGEGRKISHESTVRVALWGMRNHFHCTVKNKKSDKIRNKPRSGHDILIKLYSHVKCTCIIHSHHQ